MDEQIIDILGIGTREDSYTDLIAYAFVNNQFFQKNLLALFGEEDGDDWQVYVRIPVAIQYLIFSCRNYGKGSKNITTGLARLMMTMFALISKNVRDWLTRAGHS